MTKKELKSRNARVETLANKMANLALPVLEKEDFATAEVSMERLFTTAVMAIAEYHGSDPLQSLHLAASHLQVAAGKMYIKEIVGSGAVGVNPKTPFQAGDIVTYMAKGTTPTDVMVLDHIEPRSDKKYDIYYRLLWSGGDVIDRNEGRMWHVGSGLRYATYEEITALISKL